jgi:hypothetical protein
MRPFFSKKIKKLLLVTLLYALHLVAMYAVTSFIMTKILLLQVLFYISVGTLCLSVVVGWLIAADDFREAFIRYKQVNTERDPSSEFTIFAPLRFLVAILLWPYLVVFMNDNQVESGESVTS